MRIKKHLNKIIITRLTLKGIGKLYFVPLLFLFVVIPSMTFMNFAAGYDYDTCYYFSYINIQSFFPFFAIWWTLFGFREYIEGSGREILIVYKKIFLPELLLIYIFYFLHFCILLLFYVIIIRFNYWGYIFIFFCQSFAFFSITISLSIFLKSIAIPFIFSILYEVFCMNANADFLKPINMLSDNFPDNIWSILFPYIFIFLGSTVMLALSKKQMGKL